MLEDPNHFKTNLTEPDVELFMNVTDVLPRPEPTRPKILSLILHLKYYNFIQKKDVDDRMCF